jgi:hypothetical protein
MHARSTRSDSATDRGRGSAGAGQGAATSHVHGARRSQLYSHACSGHRIEEARQSLVISIGRPDRIASHRSSAQGQNRRAWRPNGAHQRPVDRQAQSELQSFASLVPNSCPWISECACSSCCRAIDADNSFFSNVDDPGLFIYIRDTIDSFGHNHYRNRVLCRVSKTLGKDYFTLGKEHSAKISSAKGSLSSAFF